MVKNIWGNKIYGGIHQGGGGGGEFSAGGFSGHRINIRFSSRVLIEQSIYKMKKIKHGEGN